MTMCAELNTITIPVSGSSAIKPGGILKYQVVEKTDGRQWMVVENVNTNMGTFDSKVDAERFRVALQNWAEARKRVDNTKPKASEFRA